MFERSTVTGRIAYSLTLLIRNDILSRVPLRSHSNTGIALIQRLQKECNLGLDPTDANSKNIRGLYTNLRYFYEKFDAKTDSDTKIRY